MSYLSKSKNKLSVSVNGKSEIERLILILSIGFMTALEETSMEADETEVRFFAPYSIKRLEDIGISKDVIDLIHKGLFLDDVKRLCSNEAYLENINQIKELALALLKSLPEDNENKHWIDND